MKLNEILEYKLKKHTKDNSDLNVYEIKEKISKDDYINLNIEMKKNGCYYSKFVKGFICKTVLDLESLSTKEIEKKEKTNVKYYKKLTDYISLEDYKDFLRRYAKENYNKSWNYQHGHYETIEDAITSYEKELLNNVENALKYDYFGELSYIREAILAKSLGFSRDTFRSNGNGLYYKAIWDILPIIKDLKLTDEAYSATWGYDQTNVDIAYRTNKKVWGLDIFRDQNGQYYLVRMKDGRFHDSVRYFSRDHNPEKTFEMDASQTGQYR